MAAPKRVFLAARYARRKELIGYKETLESNGFAVTSRWLTIVPDNMDDWNENATEGERVHYALMDWEDIQGSSTVIVFTEDGKPVKDGEQSLGGHHTEFGMAVALKKKVVIVGPRENIFHYMPGVVVYPTWEMFVKFKGLK